jgi:hypothetical protein
MKISLSTSGLIVLLLTTTATNANTVLRGSCAVRRLQTPPASGSAAASGSGSGDEDGANWQRPNGDHPTIDLMDGGCDCIFQDGKWVCSAGCGDDGNITTSGGGGRRHRHRNLQGTPASGKAAASGGGSGKTAWANSENLTQTDTGPSIDVTDRGYDCVFKDGVRVCSEGYGGRRSK